MMTLEEIERQYDNMTPKERKIRVQDLMLDYLIENEDGLEPDTLKNIRDMVADSTTTNSDAPWMTAETIQEVAGMAKEWREKTDLSDESSNWKREDKKNQDFLMDNVIIDSGRDGPVGISIYAKMKTQREIVFQMDAKSKDIHRCVSFKPEEWIKQNYEENDCFQHKINGKEISEPDRVRYYALLDKDMKVLLTATSFDFRNGENKTVFLNRHGSPMIDEELRGEILEMKSKLNLKECSEQMTLSHTLGGPKHEMKPDEEVQRPIMSLRV